MKHEASLHPRPQLARASFRMLGGPWQFAEDQTGRLSDPSEVHFDRVIQVPFPPESDRSGIGDEGFHPVVWYRRTVVLTPEEKQQRLLLHFGAVDYSARVWVNGHLVVEHTGGHTPFCADITEAAARGPAAEIVVRADDDPADLAKPRGKQDWRPSPHAIWYPRTTGIWQPVWLEPVPETRIERLSWTPHLDRWELGLEASVTGPLAPDMMLRVRIENEGAVLSDDRYTVTARDLSRRIGLPDPGIDHYQNELLWSPENPTILDAKVELYRSDALVDRVQSYTALRSVGVGGNRFILNGHPYYLRLVLDQGYWPDTLLAAPDAAALRKDVELAKRLGFNGIRMHQKLEDPRFLYCCDRLGMLVWVEMPSAYRFTALAVERLCAEWLEAVRRDYSHPSVIAWVPLNESWGVPDLPVNPSHRDYVRALYHLTKTLDPTRPVVGNDGWEHVATDIITIHDYASSPAVLRDRYATPESISLMLERQQPGGRALAIQGFSPDDLPCVLSELGGIAFIPAGEEGWGYALAADANEFIQAYSELLAAVHESLGLAGFCYTQLTDTFQEKNGLLFADRRPKADIELIARATRGEHLEPGAVSSPARWRKKRPSR